MPSAYLLVSHGSRDSRPKIAMQQLACLLSDKIKRYCGSVPTSNLACIPKSETLVGTAYLEFSPQPLYEQIREFGLLAVKSGYHRLKILPLFLQPGVHVMEDIPAQVALAQNALGQVIMIELRPYLGSYEGLERLLTPPFETAQATILLAHGSRRPGCNVFIEAMAARLGTVAAYWSVPHSLESRIREFVVAGFSSVAILPYFLFVGGITDAIAEKLLELQLMFPEVSLLLGEPLGASPALAEVIWDLVER
jgi:sirohydrochlorin cobaltochelatase